MVSFLQLAAEKKDTIFGVARQFFGPSYFVATLGPSLQAQLYIHLATVKLSLSKLKMLGTQFLRLLHKAWQPISINKSIGH